VTGTPVSAPETGLAQQFSKSFALRDQGHPFFTSTSMEEEMLLAGERQPTNPFRFGLILSGGHPLRPRRNARLKLLTLSYFNHTAGRRFLPFGLSTLPLSVD
jgi:hypothetical protein